MGLSCKHVSFILLCFFITILPFYKGAKANDADLTPDESRVFRAWKDAVVRIEVRQHPGALADIGTGFFISPGGTLVTNFHVMKTLAKNPNADVTFFFANGRKTKDFWVGKCQESAMVDVCILNLPVEPKKYFTPTIQPPARGHIVYNIGNPLGEDFVIKSGVYLGEYARNNANYIAVSNHIQPGDSGGPIFSEDGKAFGMSTLTVYTWVNSGLSRGVSSETHHYVGLGAKEISRAREQINRYVPRQLYFH